MLAIIQSYSHHNWPIGNLWFFHFVGLFVFGSWGRIHVPLRDRINFFRNFFENVFIIFLAGKKVNSKISGEKMFLRLCFRIIPINQISMPSLVPSLHWEFKLNLLRAPKMASIFGVYGDYKWSKIEMDAKIDTDVRSHFFVGFFLIFFLCWFLRSRRIQKSREKNGKKKRKIFTRFYME